MRFVPSEHIRFTPADVIFRQSVRAPLATTLLLLLGAAGVFLAGIAGKLPAVVSGLGGSSLLLFSAFSAVMVHRARSPANWLLACDGRRVLINFRSYLNAAFPAGVPHVLEDTADRRRGRARDAVGVAGTGQRRGDTPRTPALP